MSLPRLCYPAARTPPAVPFQLTAPFNFEVLSDLEESSHLLHPRSPDTDILSHLFFALIILSLPLAPSHPPLSFCISFPESFESHM